jgi:hypothetical protein
MVLGLFSTSARSASSTSELANAERVSDYLVLRFEEGAQEPFRFKIDKPALSGESPPLRTGMTFSADRDKGMVVDLMFLNPIKYTWSISEQGSDDPTYESARRFVESANALFKRVSPEVQQPASGVEGASAAFTAEARTLSKAAAPPALPKPLPALQNLHSPVLVEWAMWMEAERGAACRVVAETQASFEAFADQLVDVDKKLVQVKEDKARPSNEFRALTEKTLQTLLDASTVKSLNEGVGEARKNLKALKERNDAAEAAIKKIDASKIAWSKDQKMACELFGRYTNNTTARFVSDATEILKTRRTLVTKLEELVTAVEQVAKRGNKEQDFFHVGDVSLPAGKMKDVTVTIRGREIKIAGDLGDEVRIEEKEEVKVAFRVREAQTFILEFAPGVVFTTVSYPKFGTAEVDGRTVVAEAGSERYYFSAVGMLNVVPNFNWGGLPRPVAQIGLGTGEKYPLLLAGGGLRLLSPIDWSLTFGAAWSWKQRLTDLKLGDTVTGTADVEKDLHYELEPKPAFYIGVQTAF